MSQKTTIEEIRKIFNQVGLELLEDESKGVDYKYDCRDSDGYLYKRSPRTCLHTLRKNKRYGVNVEHTFSTKNPYFYRNMMLYMDNHNDCGTVLLTEEKDIKNIDQHLAFKCGICGREFNLTWHSFVHKNDKCCNICFRQKKSAGETNTRHVDSNRFHQAALVNGLVILDDCKIKCHNKVVVQDGDGYRGLISTQTILKGQSFEKFGSRNPYALDNLRIFAFKKKWDCVIYNQEYNGYGYPLKMMCSCGNDFEVTVDHFIAGKYKCNECRVKQSAIADKIELWLNENGIDYIKEKRFNGCVGEFNKTLPFDFYLPKYNSCIEVDGIGHYRPVAFGGNKKDAEKTYQDRLKNDATKDEYCKTHNINLLRVPFWVLEKDEHDEYLKNFILPVERDELNK